MQNPPPGEESPQCETEAVTDGASTATPEDEAGAPPNATSDPQNAEIAAMEARLLAGIEQMHIEFTRQFGVTETRDRQIEAMRREIETLRGDVVAKTLRPLIVSVINAHDNLSKVIGHYLENEPELPAVPVAEVATRLRDVQQDLELALSENGVSLFSESNAGGPFNGQRQRVIGYVPPEHPDQAGCVAECARTGFETDAGLIEKERVRIYRGEPARPAASASGSSQP